MADISDSVIFSASICGTGWRLVAAPAAKSAFEVPMPVGALCTRHSRLVHAGVVPAEFKVVGTGKRPSHEVVTAATAAGAQVIAALIERGALPDWYQFELAAADHLLRPTRDR